MAIEKLIGVDVPVRAQYIRVMFDEITRILNHLMWIGSHALDVGAMTVFLYAFREREDLMDMYEAVSGARMHAAYYRPGGVYRDLPDQMPQYAPSHGAQRRQGEGPEREPPGLAARLHRGLHRPLPASTSTTTRRCSPTTASGSSARSASAWSRRSAHRRSASPARCCAARGIAWDLRKKQPYEVYDQLDFDIPVGTNGDCYDRYLVRVQEMRESNRIIKQCVDWLRKNPGPVITANHKVAPPIARRDEGEHGGADPPLQALQRRHARAAGRGLCRGRASRRASSASSSCPTAPTSRGA